MPKTVCYGILHPTKGLIGRDGDYFPNQEKPDEISLASLLFTNEMFTKSHRDNKWKDCEVVPVSISCPEFSLPKTQSDMWEAAEKFISQYPNVMMHSKFRDWMLENEIITESESELCTAFPFRVPFPKMYGSQKYEIITVAGEKFTARVDDSCEFKSEGLEWKTLGENRDGNKTKAVVVAWKHVQPES